MNHFILLTGGANPFETMTNPIINLLNMALPPALMLVGALGAIYCIFLGVKLAKAEEPQEREKAKSSLKNAIIGFVLIFVLLVVLRVGLPAMQAWSTSAAPK
jgi:heme O synthase-like polyprenyltransferase